MSHAGKKHLEIISHGAAVYKPQVSGLIPGFSWLLVKVPFDKTPKPRSSGDSTIWQLFNHKFPRRNKLSVIISLKRQKLSWALVYLARYVQ